MKVFMPFSRLDRRCVWDYKQTHITFALFVVVSFCCCCCCCCVCTCVLFVQQFVSQTELKSTAVALDAKNKNLNRYTNVIACESIKGCHLYISVHWGSSLLGFISHTVVDENRVVLEPLEDYDDCQNDYINAAYINVCVVKDYTLSYKLLPALSPPSMYTIYIPT